MSAPPPPPGKGRPKGTLNRATLYARAYMELHVFNPIKEPMAWVKDDTKSDDSRLTALRELTDRFAPRLKSVEVNNTSGNPLTNVTIQVMVHELRHRRAQEFVDVIFACRTVVRTTPLFAKVGGRYFDAAELRAEPSRQSCVLNHRGEVFA